MASPRSFSLLTLVLATLSPLASAGHTKPTLAPDGYAPAPAYCTALPLVRPAVGLNPAEVAYVQARKPRADEALAAWLKRQGDFDIDPANLPTLAFASSGGGMRALLTTAGVVQALDGRESIGGGSSGKGVAGLYQAFTYESGLSGGAWFLSSFAGNNWPTISELQNTLWNTGLNNSGLDSANLVNDKPRYDAIISDLERKQAAGFELSLIDPYGRALSYALLRGPDGGVSTTLSGLAGLSNYTGAAVPFPIITARGVDDADVSGQCNPTQNSSQWEFTPVEYGSWDGDISAFAATAAMGSALARGKPTLPFPGYSPVGGGRAAGAAACTAGYDNLGYILGTSSDLFNILCGPVEGSNASTAGIWAVLSGLVTTASDRAPNFNDLFGLFPNPFLAYSRSSRVSSLETLTLTDGGQAGQNIPIWPFLVAADVSASDSTAMEKAGYARPVDVLIASDNSADTNGNLPSGDSLWNTQLTAGNLSLVGDALPAQRLPYIPPPAEMLARNLTSRAVFFGCNATSSSSSSSSTANKDPMLIIYLPNTPYTYASGQSTFKVAYTPEQTAGMLQNGNAVATQNGADPEWPFCVACAVVYKQAGGGAKVPAACGACFARYCYYKEGTTSGG